MPQVNPHRLLFVCTANICRSPMAESLAMLSGEERGWWVQALSCGTEAMDGMPAAPNAVKVIQELGGDLSQHASQPVSAELVRWADRVLVMELRHASWVREHFPQADEKIQLLGTFGGLMNVPDPYGSWIFKFRSSRDQIRQCVEGFLDSLPPRPLPRR
jgi:protein-tyrosine-phosphatase